MPWPFSVSFPLLLTQTCSCPGSLHLAPELGPKVEFLGFIYEVSALQAAAYKRLGRNMSHWYMQCILRNLRRTVLKPTLISSDSM